MSKVAMEEDKYFPILSIHRDDLERSGFDVSNVTDRMMEELALKMGEAYLGSGFWEDLEACAEFLGIPRIKKEDEEMGTDKVIIFIKNGAVFDVEAPESVDVVIRDYDIDGIPEKHLKIDEDGDYYNEQIW